MQYFETCIPKTDRFPATVIIKLKQGRCNEGFNAEPITFAFCICICILHFEFKFPAKNSGEKFRFGRKFMVWVKMLGSGENFVFGENFGLGRKFMFLFG